MAAATDASHRNPMVAEPAQDSGPARVVPIPTPRIQMSAPSPTDHPMDISSPPKSSSMPESDSKPADAGSNGAKANGSAPPSAPASAASSTTGVARSGSAEQPASNANSMPAPPAAAAAAVHQPKIVQTAFIHKLYNMLEDQSIHHLISWSPNEDSFVMSPTPDFSKVLAQYFKHTNISSFVRQLNMYGFHKVSDVFHTTSPDTALWEFKHGGGNFKRGDLVGLREIKRRASKHSLVHREYNSQKPSPLQPGTPAEPMPMPHDAGDARLAGIEHSLYDVGIRLQRSEESAHYMHVKHQAMSDMLAKSMQFNQELARLLLALVPTPDHPIYRDAVTLQGEIHRQSEAMRAMDEPHEQFANARQYFSNVDNGPVSPRQLAQDDPRRNTLNVPQPGRANPFYRPPVPSNLSPGARRPYGSFGAPTAQTSPNSLRPPPPPPPHPLTNVDNLARRHTAADIRAHGWQGQGQPGHGAYPPPPPAPVPSQWPTSPSRVPPEDQRIRDSFSSYSLQAATQRRPHSRPATPPPPFANGGGGGGGGGGGDTFGGWSFGSAGRGENKNLAVRDGSGPPTRRSSMAHILNPADTAEKDEEEEDPRGDDDRKRKRLQ